MTKPAKIDVVTDWNTPDPLKLAKKNPAYSYRWIRKNDVELRKQQGWETVESGEIDLEQDLRVSRGESSIAQCNELILCKRPSSMNKAHRKFIDDKNKRVMDALGSGFHQEGQRSGFATYGEVKLEKIKS